MSDPIVWTLLVVALIWMSSIVWRSTFWRRHGVRGPSGCPLFGNMLQFALGRRHYGDVYEQLYKEHSEWPYVGIYRLFNEPAVLLRSQAMVKEIMIRSFQHFQDNVLWIDPGRDPIIWCNPFVAKGDKWRQMRAEIVPIFKPSKVKMSFPHIATICQKLRDYVHERMAVDSCFEAKDLFSKYTLDVVASAAYGLDAQSFTNRNSDFTKLVEHLFQPNALSLLETVALLFSPALGHLMRYCYVPPGVQRWLRSMIGSVLEERLRGGTLGPPRSDFLQWLIEARRRLQQEVDVPTLVGHSSTFLLEGFETSSSLMAFALYEYAVNPSVQRRVRREIDEALERHGGELSYEALQEMPYFEASLFETLRLHPPMMALLKHCTKAFTLPAQDSSSAAFAVPEGMVFVVPVSAIHQDPELYPEPLRFRPERFLGQHDSAFLGFGDGPRMCPGMRFGLAQSKAGLVTLLAEYCVELAPRSQAPLQIAPTTFLTAAKDGIWIRLRQRQAASGSGRSEVSK